MKGKTKYSTEDQFETYSDSLKGDIFFLWVVIDEIVGGQQHFPEVVSVVLVVGRRLKLYIIARHPPVDIIDIHGTDWPFLAVILLKINITRCIFPSFLS